MFNKRMGSGVTYISENSRLKGVMNFTGEVIIHGEIEGDISCDGAVTIGKTGTFHGRIQAASLFVSGKIDGEFECELMQIEQPGEVRGVLFSEKINISEGGQFFRERKGARKPDKPQAALTAIDLEKADEKKKA